MKHLIGGLALLLALLGSGCASLSQAQHAQAVAIAQQARSQVIDCDAANACAQPSALRTLADTADADSTPQVPRHYALLLDRGENSLLARLNLIRSARTSVDVQTYIFDTDDSSRMILDALLAAARRGVKVRLLIDQLSAISDLDVLAALSGVHRNFQLRIYNPTFNQAMPGYLDYAASVICCFRRFNQRMHTKLLLVDDAVGITGGRNYQDDYYDWDAEYNFRDRDVLVAGPEGRDMGRSFEQFWEAPRSIPVERLNDVARTLLDKGVPPMPADAFKRPQRVAQMDRDASDPAVIQDRLASRAMAVGTVSYIADTPRKHRAEDPEAAAPSDWELGTLLRRAQREILMQTPYLVMSDQAERFFAGLRKREDPPRVVVSTNSLAATDNPIVYSVSAKYKRMYLRKLGFHLYEYKPFPEDAPVDYATLLSAPPVALPGQAVADTREDDRSDTRIRTSMPGSRPFGVVDRDEQADRAARRARINNRVDRRLQRTETRPSFLSKGPESEPVPLKRAGVRMGLHAKSMVIDGDIAVIGTHNFDPRSIDYNTEAVVVIPNRAFAQELEASIHRDIEPENSWVIAPREKPPILSGLNYSLDKVSSSLPVFDIWPWRYATSYEFMPSEQCPEPLQVNDPMFHTCYKSVGDFPEVSIGPKRLYARILIAFGAGLVPIL
ncbi:phospholipase D family protein [Pseudoxanthomonas sp. JBR18]|uniref:phospholipase D family protein n=1 Tax=Pseudoxanthomonas sp. JBR18 TaxID=2969308 RepID=UPI002306BFDC|nr:phospholipase D family protein [Pseudoxanthomonas sp. JBR18]WCE06086.1 phospholipase D family protein [Pseudoxanthomonas sp. JBR18]